MSVHDNIAARTGASLRVFANFFGGATKFVNELEAEWEEKLLEAQRLAQSAGRGDVADYLSLRAENDAARAAGVAWLLEAFAALAGEANRAAGVSVSLAREEPHRFKVGASTMVGTRLTLRAGLRSLAVEAGWPRAPRDGIVRGGGLACARLEHFGDRAAAEDLLLVRPHGDTTPPHWIVVETTGTRSRLLEDLMRRHLAKLLGG